MDGRKDTGHTDTDRQQRLHLCIASHDKKCDDMYNGSDTSSIVPTDRWSERNGKTMSHAAHIAC